MSALIDALPDSLRTDHLYIFLIGPGTGECVLIRFPGGSWAVVDSCKKGNDVLPWSAVLSRYGVTKLRLLVLTHPHFDHYNGMVELLDICEVEKIAFVGAPDSSSIPALPNLPNFADHDGKFCLDFGRATATFNRFYDEIASGASMGVSLQSGVNLISEPDFSVDCLCPSEPRLRTFFSQVGWEQSYVRQANTLSSVLRLEWKKVNFYLGGDLPNEVWVEFPIPITEHASMKVPHHGSKGSVSEVWADSSSDRRARLWLVSAYQSSGLPRFEDGEGLDLMLQRESKVLLSCRPATIPGRQIRRAAALEFASTANPNPSLFARFQPVEEPREPQTCLVGGCFDESGACLERYCLSGALEVSR